MRRTIFIYSIAMAFVIFGLKWVEHKYFLRDLTLEFYIGTIAVLFTFVGIWAGRKLVSHKKEITIIKSADFVQNTEALKQTGISPREFEVLECMAQGLSNQEIADKLFVSLSTVKTHSANLFAKLDVKRRTQAVQRAKELGLIS